MHGHQNPITNLWHLRYRYFFTIFVVADNLKFIFFAQSFGELSHRPLLVDLTIEDQSRLKVIYGSAEGFHAVDLDSATVYDVYLPKHVKYYLIIVLLKFLV